MNIAEKIKNSKKTKYAIVATLCILLMIIYFFPEKSNKSTTQNISNNTVIEKTAKEQLEEVLCNIKGTGKVSVMITYESGNEVVCANNVETQMSTVTEKTQSGTTKESETVIESKTPITIGAGEGENPLVIIEKEPQVRGVIVVAEGADDLKVRMNLQKAVETVLQVSPDQVEIFAMN
jgi:stage III sporulation protein AG